MLKMHRAKVTTITDDREENYTKPFHQTDMASSTAQLVQKNTHQ
jgi:hypothetical protein